MSDATRPANPLEARAVVMVVETLTSEALKMSLSTPKGKRGAEMLAIHATVPDQLVAHGVEPGRALELAKGIWVKVEVADDEN